MPRRNDYHSPRREDGWRGAHRDESHRYGYGDDGHRYRDDRHRYGDDGRNDGRRVARKGDRLQIHYTCFDEDGKKVPTLVLFSDKNDGLVLVIADIDQGFVAKNNAEYTLKIEEGLVDNDGNELAQAQTITFRTYNQKVNNMVNMGMMFFMFGGIMFFTIRQNNKKEEEQVKEEPKEAFNPYREAKRTGKSVEEVMAEQAKKEEKLAKKRARKNKNKEAAPQEGKIENCAELLNNVYHVHAPAPISKEDRSVNALISMRKEAARAEKAEKAAQSAARARKKRR